MQADHNNTGSSPNLEQLMQLGKQTARKGNKQSARVIFQQILDADKQNERAWLWMAALADTPEERLRYLMTVLRINPHNVSAQRLLSDMQKKRVTSNTKALRYGLIITGVLIVLVLAAVCLVLAVG